VCANYDHPLRDDRADVSLQTQPLCHGSQNDIRDRHKQWDVGAVTDIRAATREHLQRPRGCPPSRHIRNRARVFW